jgi:hypothetical protein
MSAISEDVRIDLALRQLVAARLQGRRKKKLSAPRENAHLGATR